VINIMSEPSEFALNAALTVGNKPQWGTCAMFAGSKPFITTRRTTSVNEQVIIYGDGAGYNYTIDW
jgi:hypothetical protein